MNIESVTEPSDWMIAYDERLPQRSKATMLSRAECRPRGLRPEFQLTEPPNVSRFFRVVRSYLDKKLALCGESEWSEAQERLTKREVRLTAKECTRLFFSDGLGHFQLAQEIDSFAPTLIEIQSVWQARQEEGWDGYDALPIMLTSRDDVIKFLHQLPSDLMQPDVVPENDGTLALEWQDGDSVFVISFQGLGKVIYAGDFDSGRRTRGHENLAKGIPQTIATILGAEFAST